MASKTLSKVATKLLTESLGMKKGETVTIETWETGLPLAVEVVKAAREMGCIPVMLYEDEEAYIHGVRKAPKDVLGLMGKHEYGLLTGTDAYVFIPGPPMGAYYKGVSREEYSASTKYNGSWYEAAEKARLRGVRLSFGYVGKDLSNYLGKKTDAVVDAQLEGVFADFGRIRTQGRAIAERLRDGSRATISTKGGELRFRLQGDAEVEDGIVDEQDVASGANVAYLPPGMVTKGVDKSSASGKLRTSPSLTRLGVTGPISLTFEAGALRAWSGKPASMIEELLKPVKEPDRLLSMLTVGLNDRLGYGAGVDRFVAGSMGIAGYGFVGVVRDGTLEVDGSTLIENGKVTV